MSNPMGGAEPGDGDGRVAGTTDDDEGERAHLEEIECGAGCTEIWEHLSDHRADRSAADD